MMPPLQIGPLVLPWSWLLLVVSTVLGLLVGRWWGRRRGIDAEPSLWRVLLVGLVVARLAYVWTYRSAYLASPLDIIDIRDGGWSPQAGLIAAWVYGLVQTQRDRRLRRPMAAALAVTSVVWIAGSIALVMQPAGRSTLPDAALAGFDGSSASLQRFAGKPTVVNLWKRGHGAGLPAGDGARPGQRDAGPERRHRHPLRAAGAADDAVLRRQRHAGQFAHRRAVACDAAGAHRRAPTADAFRCAALRRLQLTR